MARAPRFPSRDRVAAQIAEIGDSPGLAVRIAGRAFTRVLQLEVARHGLNAGEFRVLRTLGGANHGLTQFELASLTAMDRPYVTTTLKHLALKELVRTERSATDRRRINVVLTAKGIELREAVLKELAPSNNVAVDGIEQPDLETFHRVIRQIITNLERAYPSVHG